MYYLSASFRKSCDVVISKRWWHPIIITSMTSCVGLDDSINSIIEYLHNGSMSMRLIIWEDKASQDCNQRQMNSYGSQKSCHSYNFPISTAMITYPQDDVIDADDATIVDECWSENESNIVNGLIKPIPALLNKSASTNNVDQLIMKAMISFHRLGCGCCEGDHNTDCCWACGPEFQPLHIRKAVQHYNLKHGVEPKRPPLEKAPTPRGASFGALKQQRPTFGPQLRSISLPLKIKQTTMMMTTSYTSNLLE